MSFYREKNYKTKLAKPEIFTWYSKRGAVSIFIYSANVLKDGALSVYDEENRAVRSVQNGGAICVPASFFERFLGLSVKEEADSLFISKGRKTLSLSVGSADFELSGKIGTLSAPIFLLNEHKYVPVSECAVALGIEHRAYDGGKMIIFANKEMLDEIERDEELEISASYATVGKYDASKFTSEDFETVKKKWRTVLVASPELCDLSDPYLSAKLEEMSDETQRVWSSLRKEEGRVILFGNAPPEVSADLTRQYANLWILTKGYATFGTRQYGNEELKSDILNSLRWLYENMYGEAEIEDRGWRSMKDFNWWDWFWGSPEPLTNILLVMEEHLTKEEITTYLRPFRHVMTIHRVGYKREYAMSRLTVCTKAALLLEDRALLLEGCADYDLTLSVTRTEEGVHTDYVEWTHSFPYNMMYGFNTLSRSGFVGTLLGGTAMEYVSPKQYELFNVAKYMFEAACYKGQGFVGFNGRATSGTEFTSGVYLMNGILPLIGLFGEEEDVSLKKLIKRCASTPELVKRIKTQCSVYNFAKLMEILNDDTVKPDADYELCHAWYTADRIVQHRNDYAFFVAMTSKRHPSYESINSANKRGWYTCDGAVYFYTDTDRNSFDGVNFIMNPDICQRIPGTTVDVRARQPWSYICNKGWRSPQTFSGSMDVDKRFGMAAFDYESYNYSGHECDGTSDSGGGGGLTFWENDLRAKKSYYFFDKEMICLGAGISSTMNSEVITTVEHRRLVKDCDILGGEDIRLDGALMPKESFKTEKSGASWVSLEGFAGYVMLEDSDVYLRRYNYVPTTEWRDCYFEADPEEEKYKDGKPFFELGISHGENPKNASYAYAVIPYAEEDKTAAYAKEPEVEILSNTKRIQAVRKLGLGLTFVSFHSAGECAGVKVSAPCLLSLYEKDGALTVSVSEPTREVDSIKVTLDKKYKLINASIRAEISESSGVSVINVDVKDLAGEAVRVCFKL